MSRRLGVSLPTVGKWRKRFVVDRMDGLRDEPRPGAPRPDRPKSDLITELDGYLVVCDPRW
ncbi:helix-turn-helix domain-containing protein [Micromonospora viridifaciens]|uniref:helix-turn-helix domain-containing protein n=1 Tax=Micromonospora viridifaciens TaxID=1881 RepID=UPI0026D6ED2E